MRVCVYVVWCVAVEAVLESPYVTVGYAELVIMQYIAQM